MKQNLLMITQISFWKQDIGSRQRIFTLVNYLDLFFNVKVLYLVKKTVSDTELIKQYNLEKNIIFIDDEKELNSYDTKLEDFINKHTALKQLYNITWYRKVAAFLQENRLEYNSVIVEYIHLSYLLPLFNNKICILDTHDIMNIRNSLFKKNNISHWIDISENEELILMQNYNNTLCIQNIEYKYLKNKFINSILVPHAIDINKREVKDVVKNIIFIGGNNYANIHSLTWFLNNIWEHFTNLDIRLFVYGLVVNSFSEKDYTNVKLIGEISKIEEAYENADIAINPVFVGGGLKIKNIEAMANSIPLITTTEGSKGIETAKNISYLCEDTIDSWIGSLKLLINSKELRNRLSSKGVLLIEKEFSRQQCYGKLINYLENNKNE